MKRKMLAKGAPSVLLACVVFAAMPVAADAISDTLTIYNPSGVASIVLTATESQEGNGTHVFFVPSGFTNISMFGKATTLCESLPCNATSPTSNFSDIFGIVQVVIGGKTVRRLGFVSDGESGTPFGNQGAFFLLESPGHVYDVTMYLDAGKVRAGWTATFVSDTEVPEPSTLFLVGAGVLGLAGLTHRKRKRS
jgi:hypothetical protein